eukprot:c22948_g1_i1 orf=578-817(-)
MHLVYKENFEQERDDKGMEPASQVLSPFVLFAGLCAAGTARQVFSKCHFTTTSHITSHLSTVSHQDDSGLNPGHSPASF